MNRAGQFTIFNFHGIGEPVVDVPAPSCPTGARRRPGRFSPGRSQPRDRRPGRITFDDGNTSDVSMPCRYWCSWA